MAKSMVHLKSALMFGLTAVYFAATPIVHAEPSEVTSQPLRDTQLATAVVESYADLVFRDYSAATNAARTLLSEVKVFVQQPTASGLDQLRKSWTEARKIYSRTETHRFYDGPIEEVEAAINAWPLDESYIDSVVGQPSSGFIQDVVAYPVLTKDVLVDLNERGGEKNISTGWHAIEFLLWGQDLNPSGPGRRSIKDFLPERAPASARRLVYLEITSELLVEHLQSVTDAWAPNTANYRRDFVASPKVALDKIFLGVTTLAGIELSQERIFVALDSQLQEDEHSCFSDTTHFDLQYNFEGLRDVVKLIETWLTAVEPSQAVLLQESLSLAESAFAQVPAPFDQAIYDVQGRASLLKMVEALEAVAQDLKDSAKASGLTRP